jgi:hypothetical protein
LRRDLEQRRNRQGKENLDQGGLFSLLAFFVRSTAWAQRTIDREAKLVSEKACGQLVVSWGQIGNLPLSPEGQNCKVLLQPIPEAIGVLISVARQNRRDWTHKRHYAALIFSLNFFQCVRRVAESDVPANRFRGRTVPVEQLPSVYRPACAAVGAAWTNPTSATTAPMT